MRLVSAPLHRIHLRTELVSGCFNVAVRSALPVSGMELILGNDIAGGKVCPVLEVLKHPQVPDAKGAPPSPVLFPACVLTHAQTRKWGEHVSLDDTFLATPLANDTPVLSRPALPCWVCLSTWGASVTCCSFSITRGAVSMAVSGQW